jgi:hypothetical protein
MGDFDYKTAPLVDALRQYPKDIPALGYNGQYLMREAADEIERLRTGLQKIAAQRNQLGWSVAAHWADHILEAGDE